MTGGPDIRFEPLREADCPMLRRWLENPPMRDWWGDPDEEFAHISGMVEGRDTTRPFIFHVDGAPLGYIQYWLVSDEQKTRAPDDRHWVMKLPPEAVGVDMSIGDPDKLSKGYGSAVLRAFCAMLFDQGFPTIFIDPVEANGRAVRAYEKAGFVTYDRIEENGGVTLLMQLTKDRFAERAE